MVDGGFVGWFVALDWYGGFGSAPVRQVLVLICWKWKWKLNVTDFGLGCSVFYAVPLPSIHVSVSLSARLIVATSLVFRGLD